jgi:hypothetical protein
VTSRRLRGYRAVVRTPGQTKADGPTYHRHTLRVEPSSPSRRGGVAYAILAHADEGQLLRLVRVLRAESPSCSILIHWDRSSPPLDQRTFSDVGNVHLLNDRVATEWGGFSLVEATLRLFRSAVENTGAEWIVLLSGHDYPIAPLPTIEARLTQSSFDAYLDVKGTVAPPERRGWSQATFGWISRRYYFAYTALPHLRINAPEGVVSFARRLAFWISRHQSHIMIWPMPKGARWRIGVAARRTPFTWERPCRFGSQWLSLSRRAARRVLERCDSDPALVGHFRRTIIPDEAFFQTVICGEDDLKVDPDNRRFATWSGDSPSHPEALTNSDFDSISRSDKDFARKIYERTDSGLLDRMDQRRATQVSSGAVSSARHSQQ